jgi:hypothetical protein
MTTHKPLKKEMITLVEFQKLVDKHYGYQSTVPLELSPSYEIKCRMKWGNWHRQKQLRQDQLVDLDMFLTHEIDFYMNAKEINPI